MLNNIQKIWDHNLTTNQNYERLGLCQNPNAIEHLRSCINTSEELVDPNALFDVPDSDILNHKMKATMMDDERNYKKAENHMSNAEIAYLRPLIHSFGDDFDAMARDIKINYEQWTRAKLKRRIARLHLVDARVIQNKI